MPKSSHREAKQKEILEQTVRERTRELETAKNLAEQKAEEIKKRSEELERFYRLTIGRELKMIDLKKQIKEMEKNMPQSPA